MTENQKESTPDPSQSGTLQSFLAVLNALVGKMVTVANSESYEDATIGHRLGAGFYDARVLEVRNDFIIIATEFHHVRGHGNNEPVKQFIPVSRVKRVSVMKSEKILHI